MEKRHKSAMEADQTKLVLGVFFSLVVVVFTATDPNDLAILKQFRKGVEESRAFELA